LDAGQARRPGSGIDCGGERATVTSLPTVRDRELVHDVRQQVREFGGAPLATLIRAGRTAPDRAALYNGDLVRYLDFNDSYLAPGETCHPSDNLGPLDHLRVDELTHLLADPERAGEGWR
jgi:hypothetical protein